MQNEFAEEDRELPKVEYDPELQHLITQLRRTAPVPVIDPVFRMQLRQRLLALLRAQQPVPKETEIVQEGEEPKTV